MLVRGWPVRDFMGRADAPTNGPTLKSESIPNGRCFRLYRVFDVDFVRGR